MKQTEILTHATHVNGWFPAVYMSCMSQNFRLFHVSNLSVRNFRIFLLMYTGSLIPHMTCRRGIGKCNKMSHRVLHWSGAGKRRIAWMRVKDGIFLIWEIYSTQTVSVSIKTMPFFGVQCFLLTPTCQFTVQYLATRLVQCLVWCENQHVVTGIMHDWYSVWLAWPMTGMMYDWHEVWLVW